jgi:ribonuclease HI
MIQKKETLAGTHWKLFIDGASRNNPGPSGAGVYISNEGVPIVQEGYFLGVKTNNQAEYYALLLGIFIIQKLICPQDTVLIISDSLLLVRQLEGRYKVKHPHLKPMHAVAKKALQTMHVDVMHVLREQNKKADQLANRGIDDKKKVPQEFITWLKSYVA